jgi:hypothetical protein
VPESDSVFYVQEVDARVRFEGKDKVVLLQNGQELPGLRMK